MQARPLRGADVHDRVREEAIAGQRLVFVGGLHRSGTSALARVLAEHPEISGLAETGVEEDEGQHLQRVYPPAKAYGGPGRFAEAGRAHLTESSELVSPESASELSRAWAPYWDMSRPLLVEKSPPNLIMGRFLQELFPGSRLVVVLRHPVVVALSTVKWRRLASRRWWRYTTVHSLVRHWFRAYDLLREDAPHLGRLHVLRYEDLLADPSAELARLQEFLGLATPLASQSFVAGHSDRYQQRWEQMLGRPVARRVRRRIESDFGPAARRYGYDVADLSVRDPWNL